MSKFDSRRLLVVLIIALMGWGGPADARSFRVGQLPNGSKFRCASCHVDSSGSGTLTAFGDEINKNFLTPGGSRGHDVTWNAMLAMLDSDGDGVSNGRELGDPDGDWEPGEIDPSIEATNPGDAGDFVQQPPPSVGAPAVTSLVIGGVTLEENANNPLVPSGMQSFEVTFDKPLHAIRDSAGDIDISALLPRIYPPGLHAIRDSAGDIDVPVMILLENPAAWASSADSLKLTATVQLPENATYQLIVGNPSAQQQYFFGTVALSDAVVSGRAMLPAGVKLGDELGSAVLTDADKYSLLSMDGGSDDSLQFRAAIVRIAPFDILESLPEQLAFELKHVPDGSYILALNQRVVDANGDSVNLSALVGLNALGAIDSNNLIRVQNGTSATGLQVALQEAVEPKAILQVRVDSIDAEKNLFFVQSDGRQVSVLVTVPTPGDTTSAGPLSVMINDASFDDPNEILSLLGSGMIPAGIPFFQFNQLMVGDTVSILGRPSSDSAIQALLVVRHESSAVIGDLNGDNEVDFSDFLIFVAAFNKRVGEDGYNPKADLNGDNAVDFSDFLIFVDNFEN